MEQQMDDLELRRSVEALLFASEKPLSPEEIQEAFSGDVSVKQIREQIDALREECEQTRRGFRVYEIAGGFQLAICSTTIRSRRNYGSSRSGN